MNNVFEIKGRFADQQGTVKMGKLTGYNGEGIPCRQYTWVKPKLAELKGKIFEAFDDQIEKARPDRNFCPKCGCHYFTHNDDGSCVKD